MKRKYNDFILYNFGILFIITRIIKIIYKGILFLSYEIKFLPYNI